MRPLLILAALMSTAAFAADGAVLYKRCAACHLPTGTGVPAAFPPLKANFAALSKKPDGRRYLILAVMKGVSGPIVIGGKTFRGVMPAQAGMNDAEIAAVLNHVAIKLASTGAGFKPFSDVEVKAVRTGASGITAAQVGQMHARVGGK